MFSFEYFFGMIILGFVLRVFLPAWPSFIAIILISSGWAIIFGSWAIATLIELLIGWSAMQAAAKSQTKENAINIQSYSYDSSSSDESRRSHTIEPEDLIDKKESDRSFNDRMMNFVETNYAYAEYLSEVFSNVDNENDDLDSDESIDKTAELNASLFALNEFMDYADEQGGELCLSRDEFISCFETSSQKHLRKIRSMGFDEKYDYLTDMHKRLFL